MNQTDNIKIEEGLRRIRRRRLLTWVSILGFLLYMPIILILFSESVQTQIIFIFVYAIIAIANGSHYFYLKCPRCGNVFSRDGFFIWPYKRSCLHCNLQLKTDNS